ncbi:hypothetical protein LSUE1_G008842 [Lachnellula suecica]|uniref:F-box domain-containing protein n=1 Tax=Lachnellula suecica TaxID=602035 RepID=A0A8T9BVI3_9HELO|nr:hypothetical protein LSUE1_G008842 [Lachnellula suecica]
MVETRRRTRSAAQSTPKSSTRTRTAKTNTVTPTSLTKRKATQDETTAKGKDKKRVKTEFSSYLQRPHNELDPNRAIPLLNLPRDIFCEMTSWLDPATLICLSLTCKEILGLLGEDAWAGCNSKLGYYSRIKGAPVRLTSRQSLIELLGRDAPHLMVCNVCIALHSPLKPPRQHRETKATKYCLGPWGTINYLPHDELGGYNLVWEHVLEARQSLTPESMDEPGPRIEFLDGDFTVRHDRLNYRLRSAGRQMGKHVVLKHEHIFYGTSPQSPLRVADIINLPVRLCAHQTTSTQKPEPGRYTKSKLPNSLLCHSISAVIPAALRTGIPVASKFSTPTSIEKRQMDAAVSLWSCRACPTKWRVRYSGVGAGEFRFTAWHSLGDTAYRAQEYFRMLVRREASNLAAEKRNSEFFVANRQYLDFAVDE